MFVLSLSSHRYVVVAAVWSVGPVTAHLPERTVELGLCLVTCDDDSILCVSSRFP
jgi:hypothetical protein